MNIRIKILASLLALVFIIAPGFLLYRAASTPRDPNVPVRKAVSLMQRIYPGSTVQVVCTLATPMNTYVTCTVGRDGSDPVSLRCPTSEVSECYMTPVR